MSYYARPAGDYKTYGYAGDPGFLSSLWKGIKSVALPIIGGLIAGPAGAAVGGAMTKPGRPQPPSQFPVPPGTLGGAISFPGGMTVSTAYTGGGRGGKFGGGTRLATYQASQAAAAAVGGVCPTGYHLDKLTGTKCVRNRRMNVANPRALRRSMRRVQGFEKLARRTITFTRRTRMKKRKSS